MSRSLLLDHIYLVTLAATVVLLISAFGFFRYAHYLSKTSQVLSQLVTYVPEIALIVLVAFWLNDLYGDTREREKRKGEIRQNHLVRLHSVLQTEAAGLSEISRRALAMGRLSSFNPGPEVGASELDSLFPDPLSADLVNHYPDYWEAKQQLLKDVQRQDTEADGVMGHVSKMLNLSSYAEHRRIEIGRDFLEKCLGKGPGFTLTIHREGGYSYSSLGVSGKGAGHPPKDLVAAFEAFRSISPDDETVKHCEALVKGAADITVRANQLARLAIFLIKRSGLTGDCEYTKLE